MTKEQEDLITKLRELCKAPIIVQPGTVVEDSIDLEELHCSVLPPDGPEILEVRLKAAIDNVNDGIVQVPVEGSTVLIASIGNEPDEWFVLAFSQVDKVMMYGGENGGLINVVDLVSKLNALENKVNDIIDKFDAHVHTGVQTGGGTSGTTTTTVGGSLTQTVREDIEDTKVLH